MASLWKKKQDGDQKQPSLYPVVIESNPERDSPFLSNPQKTASSSSLYPSIDAGYNVPTAPPASHASSDPHQTTYAHPSSSMYPSLDMSDLAENLFVDAQEEVRDTYPTAPCEATEETVVTIPGAIVHLIDKQNSVQLASGDFSIIRLLQSGNVVAVFARVRDEIQWPLAKDERVVKLDDSHYFFTLRVPAELGSPTSKGAEEMLNYGLTFTAQGQGKVLKEFDEILNTYSCFSVQSADKVPGAEVLVPAAAGMKAESAEAAAAAYWTTLAPNVEDYSGSVARAIAAGSGQLIRGIIWCGDVTVDRLKWGNEFFKKRMDPKANPAELDKQTLKRIKRAKSVTKMSEKVMTGILSGVLKVSGFFTSSVVNSKVGQKFFSLLPGEIVLASLDGFSKVCDALEVVGKNVLSTSSVVTTGLVSHRYGDQAGDATQEGLHAAGHAIGTAWAVFKIRKALNPKSVLKPSTIAKNAAKAVAEAEKSKKK
ncbi:unnamed protein product [Victoria cruziana]